LSPENLRLTAAADGKLKKIWCRAVRRESAPPSTHEASWGEDGNIVGRLIYRASLAPPR
jgi:hypothetical protein